MPPFPANNAWAKPLSFNETASVQPTASTKAKPNQVDFDRRPKNDSQAKEPTASKTKSTHTMAKAKPRRVNVHFRSKNGSPAKKCISVTEQQGVPFLQIVKKKAIKQLQTLWGDDEGVTLTSDNILVLCEYEGKIMMVGDDLKPLPLGQQKQDNSGEEKKEELSTTPDGPTEFFALEYFTTVPIDLFRTVKLRQLEPATFTNPDHASQWTKASPLYCAGFNCDSNEDIMPWYSVNGNGKLKVNGVSLRRMDTDEASIDTSFNPFGPLGKRETTGVSKMSIQQYTDFAKLEETFDPHFGILKTSVTHEKRYGFPKLDTVSIEKKNREDDSLATKRSPFFRFRLKNGVDLSVYGVAVVYDSSSPNHFTLVRTNAVNDDRSRYWNSHSGVRLYLPEECFDMFDAAAANADPNAVAKVLKEDVFKTFEGIEPERIVHGTFMCLPKVASLFGLHDLKLEASAEPTPPQGDYVSDEQIQLYKGAVVLYHLSDPVDGWDVTSSIETLKNANYLLQELDPSFCETLVDNLEEQGFAPLLTLLEDLGESVCAALLETLGLEAKENGVDSDYIQLGDALDEMRDALRRPVEDALDEMRDALYRRSVEERVTPIGPPPTPDHQRI